MNCTAKDVLNVIFGEFGNNSPWAWWIDDAEKRGIYGYNTNEEVKKDIHDIVKCWLPMNARISRAEVYSLVGVIWRIRKGVIDVYVSEGVEAARRELEEWNQVYRSIKIS
jgi:hypothetical protein